MSLFLHFITYIEIFFNCVWVDARWQ